MADAEKAVEEAPRHRGVTVYAVEGLVLALVQLAWGLGQAEVGRGLLADAVLLAPAAAAGVVTVVACAVARDNRPALGLAAAIVEQLFVGYAFVLAEAASVPDYSRVFLAGDWLGLVQGAVSAALLAVHTLLSFAATGDQLGDTGAWFDGGLLAVHALFAGALLATGRTVPGASLLAVGGAFLVAGVARTAVRRPPPVLALAQTGLAAGTAGLGLALAYTTGLTGGALVVFAPVLLAAHAVRSYALYREQRQAGAGPPAEAARVHVHDPTAQRHRPPPIFMLSQHSQEAILFANRSRLLRGPSLSKKSA